MLQKFTLVQFYAMALRFARKAKFHVQDIMSRLYSQAHLLQLSGYFWPFVEFDRNECDLWYLLSTLFSLTRTLDRPSSGGVILHSLKEMKRTAIRDERNSGNFWCQGQHLAHSTHSLSLSQSYLIFAFEYIFKFTYHKLHFTFTLFPASEVGGRRVSNMALLFAIKDGGWQPGGRGRSRKTLDFRRRVVCFALIMYLPFGGESDFRREVDVFGCFLFDRGGYWP